MREHDIVKYKDMTGTIVHVYNENNFIVEFVNYRGTESLLLELNKEEISYESKSID